MLIRVFPVLLCWFSPFALADAIADIESLIQNKQWTQAERLIQAEIDRKASAAQSPQLRLMHSQVMAGLGKNQDATKELQLLIQEFPELPEPYNNLAVLQAAAQRYAPAREALEMAVKLNPSYALAYQNLGDVYVQLAGQAYRQALTLNPENVPLRPKLKAVQALQSTATPAKPSANTRP